MYDIHRDLCSDMLLDMIFRRCATLSSMSAKIDLEGLNAQKFENDLGS